MIRILDLGVAPQRRHMSDPVAYVPIATSAACQSGRIISTAFVSVLEEELDNERSKSCEPALHLTYRMTLEEVSAERMKQSVAELVAILPFSCRYNVLHVSCEVVVCYQQRCGGACCLHVFCIGKACEAAISDDEVKWTYSRIDLFESGGPLERWKGDSAPAMLLQCVPLHQQPSSSSRNCEASPPLMLIGVTSPSLSLVAVVEIMVKDDCPTVHLVECLHHDGHVARPHHERLTLVWQHKQIHGAPSESCSTLVLLVDTDWINAEPVFEPATNTCWLLVTSKSALAHQVPGASSRTSVSWWSVTFQRPVLDAPSVVEAIAIEPQRWHLCPPSILASPEIRTQLCWLTKCLSSEGPVAAPTGDESLVIVNSGKLQLISPLPRRPVDKCQEGRCAKYGSGAHVAQWNVGNRVNASDQVCLVVDTSGDDTSSLRQAIFNFVSSDDCTIGDDDRHSSGFMVRDLLEPSPAHASDADGLLRYVYAQRDGEAALAALVEFEACTCDTSAATTVELVLQQLLTEQFLAFLPSSSASELAKTKVSRRLWWWLCLPPDRRPLLDDALRGSTANKFPSTSSSSWWSDFDLHRVRQVLELSSTDQSLDAIGPIYEALIERTTADEFHLSRAKENDEAADVEGDRVVELWLLAAHIALSMLCGNHTASSKRLIPDDLDPSRWNAAIRHVTFRSFVAYKPFSLLPLGQWFTLMRELVMLSKEDKAVARLFMRCAEGRLDDAVQEVLRDALVASNSTIADLSGELSIVGVEERRHRGGGVLISHLARLSPSVDALLVVLRAAATAASTRDEAVEGSSSCYGPMYGNMMLRFLCEISQTVAPVVSSRIDGDDDEESYSSRFLQFAQLLPKIVEDVFQVFPEDEDLIPEDGGQMSRDGTLQVTVRHPEDVALQGLALLCSLGNADTDTVSDEVRMVIQGSLQESLTELAPYHRAAGIVLKLLRWGSRVQLTNLLELAVLLDNVCRNRGSGSGVEQTSDEELLAISCVLSIALRTIAQTTEEVCKQMGSSSDGRSNGRGLAQPQSSLVTIASVLWEPILSDVFESLQDDIMDIFSRLVDEISPSANNAAARPLALAPRSLHFSIMCSVFYLIASEKKDVEADDLIACEARVVASLASAWAALVVDSTLCAASEEVSSMAIATTMRHVRQAGRAMCDPGQCVQLMVAVHDRAQQLVQEHQAKEKALLRRFEQAAADEERSLPHKSPLGTVSTVADDVAGALGTLKGKAQTTFTPVLSAFQKGFRDVVLARPRQDMPQTPSVASPQPLPEQAESSERDASWGWDATADVDGEEPTTVLPPETCTEHPHEVQGTEGELGNEPGTWENGTTSGQCREAYHGRDLADEGTDDDEIMHALQDAEKAQRCDTIATFERELRNMSVQMEVPERLLLLFAKASTQHFSTVTHHLHRQFLTVLASHHRHLLTDCRQQLCAVDEAGLRSSLAALASASLALVKELVKEKADILLGAARSFESLEATHAVTIEEDDERTLLLGEAVCAFDDVMEVWYESEAAVQEAQEARLEASRLVRQHEASLWLIEKRQRATELLGTLTIELKQVYADHYAFSAFRSGVADLEANLARSALAATGLAAHRGMAAGCEAWWTCEWDQHRAAVAELRKRAEVEAAWQGGFLLVSESARWLLLDVEFSRRLLAEAELAASLAWVDAWAATMQTIQFRRARAALESHKKFLRVVRLERDEDLARWQLQSFALVVEYPDHVAFARAIEAVRQNHAMQLQQREATLLAVLRPLAAAEGRGRGEVLLAERLVRSRLLFFLQKTFFTVEAS